jgi:hypothetical protein
MPKPEAVPSAEKKTRQRRPKALTPWSVAQEMSETFRALTEPDQKRVAALLRVDCPALFVPDVDKH